MKTNELFSASAQGIFRASNYMPKNKTADAPKKENPFTLIPMGKGITLVKCDFKSVFNQHSGLPIEGGNKYLFIFNLQDKLQISNGDNEKIGLATVQNLIMYKTREQILKFSFQKNGNYKACVFVLDVLHFESNIKDFVGIQQGPLLEKGKLMYKGFPNLKISDYVAKLMMCDKKFPENLISLGYINIVMGLLLNQYMDSKNGNEKSRSCLRGWEITELQKITEQIRKNPEQNYTVKSLARQSGVSIPKLQEGFKEMHGHTISNFIREVRLLKAEELLKNSDLNISEIVYTVGLCSRSYFSRIFKMKYKCTPTDYQRQQFSIAVTA